MKIKIFYYVHIVCRMNSLNYLYYVFLKFILILFLYEWRNGFRNIIQTQFLWQTLN